MQSLKDIKIKIQSYKKTGAVTRAMEAVSAVKMRKSQDRSRATQPYASAALAILDRLSAPEKGAEHPLMRAHTGKVCLVVVTSDKGLAGPLNNAVIKKAENEITTRSLNRENCIIIAIGRRGGDHFASRGFNVREKHENISDGVTEDDMRVITDKVLAWYAAGEFGTCIMVYTHFKNTFEQKPEVRQLVPIVASSVAANAYTIEPDPDEVLNQLLPKLVNIMVFHALLESKASEHSARMVAMKSATDKARDMAAMYTRSFNKARQAAITREVSEIVGGIEAMR